MSEQLALLCQVQEADLEIARLREALLGLDAGEGLRNEIAALEQEVAALSRQVEALETEHLDRTLELEALTEKKKRFEAQLYGGRVSNPRQLADLQEEVSMLQREGDRVETRVIELMLEVEQQREKLAAKEAELAERRACLEETETRFQQTSRRLQAEVAEWEGRRQELAAQVHAPLLKRYEQIRASKGNLGLAMVTEASCPGCRVAIPSERLKAIKAGRVGETCDNCGRLLAWVGATAPAELED